MRAAFAAGGVLIVGGWVDAKKSVGYVDWALLLLVGSALGVSKAITNSGLASYAGNAIRESGMSASTSLYVLYGFTMVYTALCAWGRWKFLVFFIGTLFSAEIWGPGCLRPSESSMKKRSPMKVETDALYTNFSDGPRVNTFLQTSSCFS